VHANDEVGIYFCFVGAETNLLDAYLPPLAMQTISAGTYAHIHHRGTPQPIPLTYMYFYHTWLAKSGAALTHLIEVIYFGDELPNTKNSCSGLDIYLPIDHSPKAADQHHIKAAGRVGIYETSCSQRDTTPL